MKITNNGEIIFTYAEAMELGMKSSSTFNTVLRELVEDKGFIDIAEQGNTEHHEQANQNHYHNDFNKCEASLASAPKGVLPLRTTAQGGHFGFRCSGLGAAERAGANRVPSC